MKLDIGAGRFPHPGFTTVDIAGEPDIKAPMWDIPLPDESVSEIRSTHSLEHVRKHRVLPTLKEWWRLLKNNGTVLIDVPDLRYCVKKWLENPRSNGFELDCIFGMQSYDGINDVDGEIHYTGFSPEMLKDYVEQAGFVIVKNQIIWSHNMDSILIVGRKRI